MTTFDSTSLLRRHVWMNTIELIRLPMYVLPTFAFPILLFVFFGLPYAGNTEAARLVMASYAAYGIIGVTLFQFGVGIAADRDTSWERYLRVLPVTVATRLTARVVAALVFALAIATAVIVTAALLTKADLNFVLLARLFPTLIAGAIPFALLGITLGYWVERRAAIPVANIIYLPLSLAGGLWMPPAFLPKFIAAVSPFLPTRHYGEVVWAAANGTPVPWISWAWLLGYAAVFAVTAVLGYRRDESRRYR
jgi:ABC-2 type transport system permease protein